MSWRRVLGAVLVSLPFVAIFVLAVVQFGVGVALGIFGAVVVLLAAILLGVDLLVNS